VSVTAACRESSYMKDSSQAGMTIYAQLYILLRVTKYFSDKA
jgi:hypothetical protein